MEATRKMERNSAEHYLLDWQIRKQFNQWLPGMPITHAPGKLLFDIGEEFYFRGHLHRSKTALKIFQIVRGGIGETRETTPDVIEASLEEAFRQSLEPVVGYYRIKRKVLKNGSVKYRYGLDKENIKLQNKFEKHRAVHLVTAVRRWNNYQPLGEFQFP